MGRRRILAAVVLAALAALPGVARPEDHHHPAQGGTEYLLNAQGNQLDAYDLSGLTLPLLIPPTTPISSHDHDPDAAPGADTTGRGNDVNGQICTITQGDGSVRYLMGEDSDQDDLPLGVAQGWGIFRPDGGPAGPWTLLDKIVPPYNLTGNDHLPDNTGCVVSADGSKLFLVDLGVGAFDVEGVGSLFLVHRDDGGNFSSTSPVCVLANDLTTAGYLAVHPDGSVLVPESGRSSGGAVSRFSPPFPAAGDTAACDAYRAGHGVDDRPNFIRPLGPLPFNPLAYVPISIVARNGKFLVGNVVPGLIIEVDADGNFTRPIVLVQPFGVAGLAVDSAGSLYWANLGLIPCATILCPGPGTGTVWKISFDPLLDLPLVPLPLNILLQYPEGMGIVTL